MAHFILFLKSTARGHAATGFGPTAALPSVSGSVASSFGESGRTPAISHRISDCHAN